MSSTVPHPKRQPKRTRVWLTGAIGCPDWHQEVHIRDLSRGGALLSCEAPPLIDTILNLYCDSFEIPARVAWAGNHYAGLQFLHPLEETALRHWLGTALRVGVPRTHTGCDAAEDGASGSSC